MLRLAILFMGAVHLLLFALQAISDFTGLVGFAVHVLYFHIYQKNLKRTSKSFFTTSTFLACVGTFVNHWNWFLIIFKKNPDLYQLFVSLFFWVWTIPLLFMIQHSETPQRDEIEIPQFDLCPPVKPPRKISSIVLNILECPMTDTRDYEQEFPKIYLPAMTAPATVPQQTSPLEV
jgi:hypothetical protein